DVADADLEATLDAALTSSLWSRRVARRLEHVQALVRETLLKRATHIWANTTPRQRRGYFQAGVGLVTGRLLDARSDELSELLIRANSAISSDEADAAIAALTAFARI